MKKKYFIFLLFLVVLCLLGIISLNSVRTYALTNVPTNSYIGSVPISSFYSSSGEYISSGIVYIGNSTQYDTTYNDVLGTNNFFISTYQNTNSSFELEERYYWLQNYNLDLNVNETIVDLKGSTLTYSGFVKAPSGEFDFFNLANAYGFFDGSCKIGNLDINAFTIMSLSDSFFGPFVVLYTYVENWSNFDINNLPYLFAYNLSEGFDSSDYGYPFGYVDEASWVKFVNIGYGVVEKFKTLYIESFDFPNLNTNSSFIDFITKLVVSNDGDKAEPLMYVEDAKYSKIYKSYLTTSFVQEAIIRCLEWNNTILAPSFFLPNDYNQLTAQFNTIYININGVWFSGFYNPFDSGILESGLPGTLTDITYNPSLPINSNYTYGLNDLTYVCLNQYYNYEFSDVDDSNDLKNYYEGIIDSTKTEYYDRGFIVGESQGYDKGYNGGYNVGYANGLEKGSDGEFTLRSLLGAIFSFPLQILTIGMDVEIFGINLGGIIMFLFALSIVAIIIKLIFKFLGR